MATHSSSLALKILWMEEPGRLHIMGLQRVNKHSYAINILSALMNPFTPQNYLRIVIMLITPLFKNDETRAQRC